VLKVTNRKRK